MESHRNFNGSCRRTQQRIDESSSTSDEGLTQAWDTVGAGAKRQTHVRESLTKRSVTLYYEVRG